MKYAYTLREPIGAGFGVVISRHKTVEAARRALARRRDGAASQGGYSKAYILDEADGLSVYPEACPGCRANHSGDHAEGCTWFIPGPGRWVRMEAR